MDIYKIIKMYASESQETWSLVYPLRYKGEKLTCAHLFSSLLTFKEYIQKDQTCFQGPSHLEGLEKALL